MSDGGGSWIRRATVLGEGGRIILTDEGVSWSDPEGAAQEAPPSEAHATAGALSRWHLLRLVQGMSTEQPGTDAALLCEALRLSCITGQVEASGARRAHVQQLSSQSATDQSAVQRSNDLRQHPILRQSLCPTHK